MKHFFLRNILLMATLVGVAALADAQQITLEDITSYQYSPKRMREVRPLADGESYSCVSDDWQKIERRSFRTGDVVEVSEEEFGFNCAFDFSADSEMLAWIRFDESAVKTYVFPWYKGAHPSMDVYALYPGIYEYKYPKAGKGSTFTLKFPKPNTHTLSLLAWFFGGMLISFL